MKEDRSRHLIEAGRRKAAEPIVTYTRVDDDGRTEPRLDGGIRDAAFEDITALPEIDAPRAHVAVDIDDLVEPEDRPRGRSRARSGKSRQPKKRSAIGRVVVLAGFLAIVGGVGVLAATFGGVVSFGGNAPAEPETAAIVHAGVEQPLETAALTDTAVSNVRVVGSAAGVAATGQDLVPAQPAAPATPAMTVTEVTPGAAIGTPATAAPMTTVPSPRLRPVTASYNPPQTGAQATAQSTAAFGPAPLGAQPQPMQPQPGVATAQPPAAAPGDLNSALASVDRILATQPPAPQGMAPGPSVPNGALPYPVLEPLPGANAAAADPYATDPYGSVYQPPAAYPAQPGYPQQQAYPGQPMQLDPYAEEQVASAGPTGASWFMPRRQRFVLPNGPVPPAEIPNAGPTWAQ